MTSRLVSDIRDRIHSEERPLRAPERAQLLATFLKPAEGGEDVVDSLKLATLDASAVLLGIPEPQRAAVRALIGAANAFLDDGRSEVAAERNAEALAAAGRRGAEANRAAAPHWADRDDRDLAWAASR